MTAIETFRSNVDSVLELMSFDDVVLEYAISQLETHVETLTKAQPNLPERLTGRRTIQALRSVRSHGSLRPQYETIYNQCVVLLVSHFGSALSDLFRSTLQVRIEEARADKALQQEFKVTLGTLSEMDWQVRDAAAELFTASLDISFQDMKSIGRGFKQWLGYERPRDEITNDLIIGQASRHAIVHQVAGPTVG